MTQSAPDSFSPRTTEAVSADGEGYDDMVSGERALWRAVITQALTDAASNSAKRCQKIERARAISWLSGKSKDFMTVCALADLDPSYVFTQAKEALKRNCQWRK